MPLHELYRMDKGKKLDSKEMNHQSTAPESDFFELVWENGQMSMHGGQPSSRVRKIPTCKSLPSNFLPSHTHRMGKFGDLDGGLNEIRMPVPSGEAGGLNLDDEDLMMPWLNYGMVDHDEPLQHEYGSDFLHELSGVTMINDLHQSNIFSFLDKRSSNCNQVLKDSPRNYASHVSNLEQRALHHSQASFAAGRCKVSDITENTNTGNATTQHVPCGEITQIFPSVSSGFSSLKMMTDKQDPIVSGSSSAIVNFTHFARPAAFVKANLQNNGLTSGLSLPRSESSGCKNKGAAAATASNPLELTNIGLRGECPKETAVHKLLVMEPSKADFKQLEPRSLEGAAAVSKQPDPPRNEDVSKIGQTSNILLCESSNKGQEAVEKSMEPVVASSSVCSGNGAERGSDNANQKSKWKRRDTEDSECHSEDVEEVSAGVKRTAAGRGVIGFKRSRSAEVHNQSERRRRDRINEKMRSLQELIPNCNKVDKASMLDEAIEYLKTLQLQVQMMSMGAGLYMHPMMLPAGMHPMHPPHMAPFSTMGVGMQMGLGMGYGMGMHDINGGSSRFPMMQVPQMQGTHHPVAPMSGPSLHGMGRPNPQVFGLPGQGLRMPMPRAPMFPFPGETVMNSSAAGLNAGGAPGLMENAKSVSTSTVKDPMQNVNSLVMLNTDGRNSASQTTAQPDATAGGFGHATLVHNHGPSAEANTGGSVNAVKADNLVVGKSCEL